MSQKAVQNNITPIIFIGYNRSGTTWLGNILKEYFSITLPIHYLHYGQLETQILSHHKYWGDLSIPENYIKFLELFAASDFFQLCNGDKKKYYTRRYNHFYDFFFDLMDDFASGQGSNYWSTKLQPLLLTTPIEMDLFLQKLNGRYSNVKYISIQRAFPSFIRSVANLGQKEFAKKRSLFQQIGLKFAGTVRYYTFYHYLDRFSKNEDVLALSFEQLKTDFETTLNKISEHLDFTEELDTNKASQYVKNTSFQSVKTKKQSLGLFLSILQPIITHVSPVRNVCYFLLNFRRKYFIQARMPSWFRLVKHQYFRSELINELQQTNNNHLADEIIKNTNEGC